MEKQKENIQPVEEEVLEQASGGLFAFARPLPYSCIRCGWSDILPPKDWKCPDCGGIVKG